MTDDELHAYVLQRADDLQAAMGWDRDRAEDIAFLCACSELGLGCEPGGKKYEWMRLAKPEMGAKCLEHGRDGDRPIKEGSVTR